MCSIFVTKIRWYSHIYTNYRLIAYVFMWTAQYIYIYTHTEFEGLLGIFNVDFSSIGVGNLGESFLRKIDGSLAAWWWAVVHNLDHNTLTPARLWNTLVRRTSATNPVHPPARCPIVPYCGARCGDHDTIVLIAIAWRSWKRESTFFNIVLLNFENPIR